MEVCRDLPPTLATGYSQLVAIVADFLGYDTTPGENGTFSVPEAQRLKIDGILASGLRQFYYPPKMDGVDENYEWSFLRMSCRVETAADKGEYVLPPGFDRVAGEIYFDGDDRMVRPLAVVSVADVLARRSRGGAGLPRFAAFRAANPPRPPDGFQADGDAFAGGDVPPMGQRVELLLAPIPDREYVLTFAAEADTGPLDPVFRPFPLGGPRFSELVIESCLAIAEQRVNDEIGQHTEKFHELLISNIARDRKASATVFGQMGDRPDIPPPSGRPLNCPGGVFRITYHGQTW